MFDNRLTAPPEGGAGRVAKKQVNGGPRLEEHHLWKRFDP